MSNLEKPQAGQPAIPSPEELGLENWEAKDLILPQLRIRQPTSDVDNVPEGKFYNVLTHEHYDTLYVIFLKSSWGRLYFDRDAGMLICRSVDRIQPSPSVEEPPASVCAACPYSKWENNQPPKCREVLNNILLMGSQLAEDFRIEDFSPCLMTIAGTSIKPMKAFVSGLVAKRKPIYSVVSQLSLEKRTGTVGKYYVLKISTVRELTPEQIATVKEAINTYAGTKEVIDASIGESVTDEESRKGSLDEAFGDDWDGWDQF